MAESKVSVLDIIQAKKDGRKLVMVTAYDYPFGLMADEAGVDMALVGDSLGMVVLGLDSTVPVTLEMMIHHIQAVVRGCKRAMVIGDMPFMSYNTGIRDAVINAGRLMKEGGCEVIKLEGGVIFELSVDGVFRYVDIVPDLHNLGNCIYVRHCPGHTKGSLVIFACIEGLVHAFVGGIFLNKSYYDRWEPPGMSWKQERIYEHMAFIKENADVIVPGHGTPFRI